MSRKLTLTCLSAICMAGGAVPAAASTTIGDTYQANVQGTNSGQSGINATGQAGNTSVLGGDSAPVLIQNSGNTGADSETLAGGDSTLIASGPGGFAQLNSGATNSAQTGVNGDSGAGLAATTPVLEQDSTNTLSSDELLAAGSDNVLIGSAAQQSGLGVNSNQSGNDFPGGGTLPSGLTQTSLNAVISEIILGD